MIHSNAAEQDQTGPGTWIRVPNADFFGRKFQAAMADFSGDVMLLIHADTAFADWPRLANRCRDAFATHPDLGVWAPDFTNTPWETRFVALLDVPGTPGLVTVAQTDGIITAFARPVIERLRCLDLSANNLGWGLDWAAIGYCLGNGLLVCRDTTLLVQHPKSRSYLNSEALAQMAALFAQLTLTERNGIFLAKSFFDWSSRRPGGRSRLWWLWHFVIWRRKKYVLGPDFFGMEYKAPKKP